MLSRVADTLYWMSRYLERADFTARIIDVHLDEALEHGVGEEGEHWGRLMASLRVPVPPGHVLDDEIVLRLLTFAPDNPGSIVRCVAAARENARQARDRISSEMWEQINRLYLRVKLAGLDYLAQPHDFLQSVMEGAQLFQGVAEATVCRDEGWEFMRLGRFIERAGNLASFLDANSQAILQPEAPRGLDWIGLLRCCSAFEAFCRAYSADPQNHRIAEFLLLNPEFPYSARFAVDGVRDAVIRVGALTPNRRPVRVERLAGRLCAVLDYGQIDEILAAGLRQCLEDIRKHIAMIHNALYQHYIQYPVDAALAL